VGRPCAAQTLVQGFQLCLAVLLGMQEQEDECFAPLLAAAFAARLYQIPASDAANILRDLTRCVPWPRRSLSAMGFETDLAILGSAIALFGRSSEEAEGSAESIDAVVVSTIREMVGRLSPVMEPTKRLQLYIRLNSSGIPLDKVLSTRLSAADLPGRALLADLTAGDPGILGETIRLAGRCGFVEWLAHMGLPVLAESSDAVLLRMPEDIFLILLDAAQSHSDPTTVTQVATMRKRRDKARERYFGAN
jgi:hypothetical protein